MHEVDRILQRIAPALHSEAMAGAVDGAELPLSDEAVARVAVTSARMHAMEVLLRANPDRLPAAPSLLADRRALRRFCDSMSDDAWDSLTRLLLLPASPENDEPLRRVFSGIGPPLEVQPRVCVSVGPRSAGGLPAGRALMPVAAAFALFLGAWLGGSVLLQRFDLMSPRAPGSSGAIRLSFAAGPGVRITHASGNSTAGCRSGAGPECTETREGDEIEVDASTSLRMAFEDRAYLVLLPSSRLRVERRGVFRLQKGTLLARVDPGARAARGEFRVITVDGFDVLVTGTVFFVAHDPTTGWVSAGVREGHVQFGSNLPAVQAGYARIVRHGQIEDRPLASAEAGLFSLLEQARSDVRSSPAKDASQASEGPTVRRWIEVRLRDGGTRQIDSGHVVSQHDVGGGWTEFETVDGAVVGRIVRHLREVRRDDGRIEQVNE